jgi:UDP-N-acetylglucosamine--N-acetylmuramyl-(pentapeptide) pyrophosphoryl-undecaprenol N-acetylglucosamine transferase
MSDTVSRTIILATGGTGGHVFPAAALAMKLAERGCSPVFLVDQRGVRYLPENCEHHVISSTSPSGSQVARLLGFLKLARGLAQSLFVMLKRRPGLVVGFGSYAMTPAIAAAVILRVPILLHEQNAVLGRAHRATAHFASKLALSQNIERLPAALVDKCVVTGNPVRAEFEQPLPYNPPTETGPFRLVVLGGSQGAAIFGQPVAEAVASLPSAIQGRLHITHQVRSENVSAVRDIYARTAATVMIANFFNEPHKLLADAHLVLTRAGATIVAEITALGRPAIFVPFAGAIDQDQMGNARQIAGHGGSVLLTEDQMRAGELARVFRILFKEPGRLENMARIAAELGRPEAASVLAELVQSMTGQNTMSSQPGQVA